MKDELLKEAIEALTEAPVMMTYMWDVQQMGHFTKQEMRTFRKENGIRYIEIDGCGYWFSEAWFLRQFNGGK